MGTDSNTTAIERLVKDLRDAHQENLASITLYGSSATGDQAHARSDHNVLVVLRHITADDLRLSQPAVQNWRNAGQPTPVFLTVDELKNGADVFPIEFLQMERARKVLHGSDPFEFVEISSANLRHQTEYELRTKFIQLRRLYASQPGSRTNVATLMIDSFASFAALFRAVLILLGHEAPLLNADAVRATVTLLGLDGSPFEWILGRRAEKASPPTDSEVTAVFGAYLTQIQQVIDMVDRLDRSS